MRHVWRPFFSKKGDVGVVLVQRFLEQRLHKYICAGDDVVGCFFADLAGAAALFDEW